MHVPVCPSILLDLIVGSVACTGEIMDIQEFVCSELSRSVQTESGPSCSRFSFLFGKSSRGIVPADFVSLLGFLSNGSASASHLT